MPGARAAAGRWSPAPTPRAGMGRAARAGLGRPACHVDHRGGRGLGRRRCSDRADGRVRRRTRASSASTSARLRARAALDQRAGQPGFGAQLSEAGGGYTWAVNSRLNQLTAWSNDPVADPPAEWFLLQDRKTLQVWSVAPSPGATTRAIYHVSHGQGYSVISHRRGDAGGHGVVVRRCRMTPSSRCDSSIVNRGHGTLHLRVIGIAEWMMGANRADRSTVHTALFASAFPHAKAATSDAASRQKLTALLCTQRDRSAGFGDGTAFLALAGAADETEDWTCDRRECSTHAAAWCCPTTSASGRAAGSTPARRCRHASCWPPAQRRSACSCSAMPPTPDAAQQLATLAATDARRCSAWRRRAALGSLARRHHGEDARPAVRRDGQPLAALPDGVVPPVGQGRLLPGRRRHRVSRSAAGRDGAGLGRARRCCASRSCCARRASSPRATCSTGGTRPPAPACARISPTTCCGWPMPACTTCAHRRCRAARRACPLHRGRRHSRRRRGRLLHAHRQPARCVGLRACRARHRSQPARGRARPAADGQRRLERRHEPRRPPRAAANRSGWAGSCAGWSATSRRWRASAASRRARNAGSTPRKAGSAALNGPAWDGAMVQARLLRRRPGAGLARQRRGPHRPDRAGLGGAVRRRAAGLAAHGDGGRGGAPGGPRGRTAQAARPAAGACGPSAGYIQAYPPGVRENGGQYCACRRVGADGAGAVHAGQRRPTDHTTAATPPTATSPT